MSHVSLSAVCLIDCHFENNLLSRCLRLIFPQKYNKIELKSYFYFHGGHVRADLIYPETILQLVYNGTEFTYRQDF